MFLRFLSNLFVGGPLLGLLGGAILFLVQSISSFREGPQEWKACTAFLQWLFMKWNIWTKMLSFTTIYCDLSLGAHIVIFSILLGIVFVPLGVLLARRLH